MNLISALSSQLGIDENQAKGGAGLLLKLAQDKLGGDFEQIRQAVPDAGELIGQAPEAGGGLMGAVGGLLGKFGGGQLGALAQLAGGFSKLGMDKSMVTQFIPVVLNYLQQQEGGDQIKALLEKVLK